MPDKLTDSEIVKALECCVNNDRNNCLKCPCFSICEKDCDFDIQKPSLDLIARLQAENERLKSELNLVLENSISTRFPHRVLCGNGAILTKSLEEYDKLIADINAEAYKEFAERLKYKFNNITYSQPCDDIIDNLLKEMVDEDGCDTCGSLACDIYERSDNNAE